MARFFEKHVFFCTNQKANGKKCCQQADAQAMCQYVKKRLIDANQHGEGKIRVSQSGCLGRCANGPCMVIYPEQVWYSYQDTDDIDKIIAQHLLADQVVSELEITAS